MKLFITICMLFCGMQVLLSQEVNIVSKDAKGTERMLGEITKAGLTRNSFATWFQPNYEAYVPEENSIKKLRRKLKKYTITIFMGTWCGDSKREVPKFLKLLEAADFPEEKLRIIGLNNERIHYKQSPNGDEKGLNIHRVPTFIVFDKNDKEIGRIVEQPVESLEADLLKICKRKPYAHQYQIVTQLHHKIEEKGALYVMNNTAEMVSEIQAYRQQWKELNTYGFVLLYANEIEKAIAVFTINAKLFPNTVKSFQNLAKAYMKAKKYTEAKALYQKVLELDTENENAKKMLQTLEAY